MMVRVFVLGD